MDAYVLLIALKMELFALKKHNVFLVKFLISKQIHVNAQIILILQEISASQMDVLVGNIGMVLNVFVLMEKILMENIV